MRQNRINQVTTLSIPSSGSLIKLASYWYRTFGTKQNTQDMGWTNSSALISGEYSFSIETAFASSATQKSKIQIWELPLLLIWLSSSVGVCNFVGRKETLIYIRAIYQSYPLKAWATQKYKTYPQPSRLKEVFIVARNYFIACILSIYVWSPYKKLFV